MKTQTLVIDNDIARQHAINLIMNSTDLIRQVTGMGQGGDFGFKLTQRGRMASKRLRGDV